MKSKTKKISTMLEVSMNYRGTENNHIEVTIIDEMNNDNIVIGEHQGEDYDEVADPVKALDDAIDVLKLMIARLEKLKTVKSPLHENQINKVNDINSFQI